MVAMLALLFTSQALLNERREFIGVHILEQSYSIVPPVSAQQ